MIITDECRMNFQNSMKGKIKHHWHYSSGITVLLHIIQFTVALYFIGITVEWSSEGKNRKVPSETAFYKQICPK